MLSLKLASVCLLLVGTAVSASRPPQYDSPVQYRYQYSVEDQYQGLKFSQQEQRQDAETSGSYQVLLPDGRTQTVLYTVSGEEGYLAEVSYQGEAQYGPEPRPYQPEPRPYRPAPRPYRPAPYGYRAGYGSAPVRARTYTLQPAAEVTEAPEATEAPERAEEAPVETEGAGVETEQAPVGAEVEADAETGERAAAAEAAVVYREDTE